jgi:hypothetical protein
MIEKYTSGIRFGLLTIRAQQNEIDVFEDALNLVLPILFQYNSFIYTVEMDNTPNRHIHIFLENPSKAKEPDGSKVFQKFKKVKQQLKKYINLKQTEEKRFWDEKLIKDTPEDFYKVLGYIQKDTLCSRRRVKNITSECLIHASEYYASISKIEKSCNKNDWTSLKPQNCHSLIEHFCKEHGYDVSDPTIKLKLTEHQYALSTISPQQLKIALSQLIYKKNQNDMENAENILQYGNDDALSEFNDVIKKEYWEFKQMMESDKTDHIYQQQKDEIEKLQSELKTMRSRYEISSQERNKLSLQLKKETEEN